MKEELLKDIKELKENLDKLEEVASKLNEEEHFGFFAAINIIHTDIIVLKNMLNYKKA
jgi:hypothetical protein